MNGLIFYIAIHLSDYCISYRQEIVNSISNNKETLVGTPTLSKFLNTVELNVTIYSPALLFLKLY